MKFEWPKGIYKTISFKDRDGSIYIWNKDKFNDRAFNDYNERIKILDIALALEFNINQIIGMAFFENVGLYLHFEGLILNKLTFESKIDIFENLLKNPILFYLLKGSDNLDIEQSNNGIKVSKFILNVNKSLKLIRDIKDIRNSTVHHISPIFAGEKIVRKTKKYFSIKQYDKEEILIKGNFIVWILSLFFKKNSLNEDSLIKFYEKYQKVLKDFAYLNHKE